MKRCFSGKYKQPFVWCSSKARSTQSDALLYFPFSPYLSFVSEIGEVLAFTARSSACAEKLEM